MNKLSFLVVGMLMLGMLPMVIGYDATTPYTVTMKWIVPDDTSFTVTLAGSETTIDFNPATADSVNVEPDSQDMSADTPIITLENTGNVNLNFTNNLTEAKPTWAVLFVNDDNETAGSVTFDEAMITITTGLAPAGTAKIFLWTNVTDAVGGTTERTYQINSLKE